MLTKPLGDTSHSSLASYWVVWSGNHGNKTMLICLPQCSKRPNPLKSRFSGALVGPSRGSRHMTSLHVSFSGFGLLEHCATLSLQSYCVNQSFKRRLPF